MNTIGQTYFPDTDTGDLGLKSTLVRAAKGAAVASTAGALAIIPTLSFDFTDEVHTLSAPTYNAGYLETQADSSKSHCKSHIDFLNAFSYSQKDAALISVFIMEHQSVNDFLSKINGIVESVFTQENVAKKLILTRDPDTDQQLLELVVESGLEINETFIAKDREIYRQIDELGLNDAFEHVVFTNA